MERRAVWRPRPDDPTTIIGWISQNGWYGTISGRIALLYTLTLVVLAAAITPWVLLALPAVAINLGRPSRAPQDLTPLVTIPPPGPAFACRMSIERGNENTVTGIDEGIATFVDGWLHYAGLRTEFSFRAKDVRGFGAPTNNPRFRLDGVLVELSARNVYDVKDLLDVAQRWYEFSQAEGTEPLMPPQAVHLSATAKAWLDFVRAIINGTATSALILLLMQATSVNGIYFLAIPLIGFGGDSSRRIKALNDFRKKDLRELPNVSKPAIGP
jgi:hypothetical protein